MRIEGKGKILEAENSIKETTNKCVKMLLEKEKEIIINTIGERTLAHKLAEYLQQEELFLEANVDVEYNRNYEKGVRQPKYLNIIKDEYERMLKEEHEKADIKRLEMFFSEVATYPDIIVHRRLVNSDNILVVEMKKSNNSGDWKLDHKKLMGFTTRKDEGGYDYFLGLHLVIDVEKVNAKLQWYKDGAKDGQPYVLC
ncbi:hypothetical protein [uncultured Sphaerochaeta sp.]|uniref:hypothetical protein n=1 Tax=uncultured Sphaerochaeta sp. TaxID=886478 RepID=UPI002A0A11A0|nr:hypothetical protein [uncultured Sphaerochaeta sp.]